MSTVDHASRLPHDTERPALIDGLLDAAAYPHATGDIELVETHISWVILTGETAYKIKKPVALSFLDFRTLERRLVYCLEELRLNRFWAPDLYLDVVGIGWRDGRAFVGDDDEPVEYAVRMRQFDQSRRLDRQLDAGLLTREDMPGLAAEIAARHLEAGRAGLCVHACPATRQLIRDNFADLAGQVADTRLYALHRWTNEALRRHAASMMARCEQGWFRECHGDLHLGNLVRLEYGIAAFDCLEFNADLRNIDVVADHAFLAMDLVARERKDLAWGFLNRYLEITGDYAGMSLYPLYFVYRCLVRAKVAAIRRRERDAGADTTGDERAIEHYVALAEAQIAPRRPTLILMHGLSGSGKTWASSQLVAELPALRVRSDLERKRLFGLGETGHSDSGITAGIYTPDAGEAVYRWLLDAAGSLLDAGLDVIVDAAFLDRASRAAARRLAAERDAGFVIVETTASEAQLRERLAGRSVARRDASEANVSVLEHQLGHAEPLSAVERRAAVSLDTAARIDLRSVVTRIERLAARRDCVKHVL